MLHADSFSIRCSFNNITSFSRCSSVSRLSFLSQTSTKKMRGSHLLLSKACKNSARARQCEDKVKFQAILPLQLKNKVSGKSDSDKEKGCLYEISVVIACLSKNNYENKFCEKEVKEFNNCFSNHMAKVRALKKNRDKGVLTPNAKTLNHREINMLFRRFPPQ